MAFSPAFTRVIVVMALLAAFTHQMSAVDGKTPVSPASLDPPQENLFPPNAPFMATITSVTNFTASNEICNVTIKHDGKVPAWEGMAYAVGIPGENATHYFMLASTRYGDLFNGTTATLCVRDVGRTSHYLCNATEGDIIGLAGPYYRNMLLPQDNPNATQIMVASDTGIGPFRGYLRRMFVENVPFHFTGMARLFYGANDTDSVFYDKELSKYAKDNSTNFKYENATDGQKGVIAAVRLVNESISLIYSELKSRTAYISFCGLNKMMPGINKTFSEEATRRGEIWDYVYAGFQVNKQWRNITWDYPPSSSKNLVEKMTPGIYNILGRKGAKTGEDANAKMKLPQHSTPIFDFGEPESHLYFS